MLLPVSTLYSILVLLCYVRQCGVAYTFYASISLKCLGEMNFLTFYGFIGFTLITLITLLELYIHFIGTVHRIIQCLYTCDIGYFTILQTLD